MGMKTAGERRLWAFLAVKFQVGLILQLTIMTMIILFSACLDDNTSQTCSFPVEHELAERKQACMLLLAMSQKLFECLCVVNPFSILLFCIAQISARSEYGDNPVSNQF